MSRVCFISLLILLSIIRPFISILLVVIRPLVPFIRNRLNFERKNFTDQSSRRHESSDYCFEVSSEGELEQVRPLLQAVLLAGKKIEILYSSPSVETKCHKIYSDYPELVRVLRMPLMSSFSVDFLYFRSIWFWVKSPVVVFCRYDFFPELLMLKLFSKKFILVSGAFKKTSWYKLESFKLFDIVVAATDLEKEKFSKLLGPKARVYSCDFRVPRINERFLHAEETLSKKTSITSYLDKLKSLHSEQKIILGSVWVSDLAILKDPRLIQKVKCGELHLLLVPHKLDDEFSKILKTNCQDIFGANQVEIVNDENPYKGHPVVILQMGGILCELYSLFKMTYVGGGYERSIHSVLEPYFSNNIVVTGPVIHRSTEFDLAREITPNEIHVLKSPESFYTIIESTDLKTLDDAARDQFKKHALKEMDLIIKDILE
jgi:3-deoxy-D-manno-octulosonic-acid transferase